MDAVRAIAARHGLFVLEDACQAHGARYRGVRAGGLGNAAAFSFYYSKNLGAYGEGGIVTTNDPSLAARLRLLRNHGSEERYYHSIVGTNSRLDELQAAVLRVKLRHLDEWNEARRRIAAVYESALAGTPGLALPTAEPGREHVYHLYVVQTPARDALQTALRGRGIATGIHYPVPVHLQEAFADLGMTDGALPATEAAANRILSLPMFPEMTDEEAGWVASCVREELMALVPGAETTATLQAAS
jgi:dTDP-4-amino-4,6-dideoxygalactose transaminase